MLDTFFGIKQKQTRIFDEAGKNIPVTDVVVEPLNIVQVKTLSVDGYDAIQVGFHYKQIHKGRKPFIGHLKKTGRGNFMPRFLREVRLSTPLSEEQTFKINDTISVEQVFKVGDTVKVTGISKAKGFQGGVKRHGFAGGPRTHGQSDRERAPGSIGQTTTPGRVYKGKRMAGRMGREQVTIKGLQIVLVDPEKKLMRIKGLIPGLINKPIIITKQ